MRPYPQPRLALLVLASALVQGCQSTLHVSLPTDPISLRAEPPAVLLAEGTNAVSLQSVIDFTLLTDPSIATLAARCHREDADLALTHAKSPELRVKYAEDRESSLTSSSGWEEGGSSEAARRTTSSSGEKTTSGSSTAVTDYGDPFDLNQIASEESTTRETFSSMERESSRQNSSYTERSSALNSERQWGDGIGIEARFQPPNPWMLAADREAATASKTFAQLELLSAESALACDVVEACLTLLHHKRSLRFQMALAAQSSSLQTNLLTAFESGGIPADVYSKGCLLAANIDADVRRTQSKITAEEREVQRLAGVHPSHIALDQLYSAPILPFPMPLDATNRTRLASDLTTSHSGLLAALCVVSQANAELKSARQSYVPWPTHLAGGYGWWDGGSSKNGTSDSTGDKNSTTTAKSIEAEREDGTTTSSERETPSGDVTTETGISRQDSYTQSRSEETESGTSYKTSSNTSSTDSDGHEWWVEIGVEIPIFEWMSGEVRSRRRAAASAGAAAERATHRVHHDILTSMQHIVAVAELAFSRAKFREQMARLKVLVAKASSQGLPGQVEALQIKKEIVASALVLCEQEYSERLARLELVRAAALPPVLSASVPTAPKVPR